MQKNINQLERNLHMLSLQNMTLIRIVTTICNNEQLLSLITELEGDFIDGMFSKTGKEFKAIRALADDLISKICNCTKINDMILDLIWPICYKIMKWKSLYAPSIKTTAFFWTYRERIDNLTTGKYILHNKNSSVTEGFVLACILCLKTEIYKLWSEMTQDDKSYFKHKNEEFRPLVLFWIYYMKGSLRVRSALRIDAFKCAVEFGLIEVVKYLLSIMPEDLKIDMANHWVERMNIRLNAACFLEEDELDIGYLLYSKMPNDNKLIFFQSNSPLILSLLLHSSEYESFLGELAERLPFAVTSDIKSFFYMLFYNYQLGVMKDHDYYDLFSEVWRMAPASVRNILKGTPSFGKDFLRILLKKECRYLLNKEPISNDERATSAMEPHVSITPYCFNVKDWEFLYFFIEEGIITVPSLLKYRSILKIFLKKEKPRDSCKRTE